MHRRAAQFAIAAVVLAPLLASQIADPLRFLPRGVSAAVFISDPAGNLYAAGSINGQGFVAQLSADGSQVQRSFTLPGGGSITALALGPGDTLFATGTTISPDFPATVTPLSPASLNEPRAFVLKLDRDGDLAYAALIGSSNSFGYSVAVNAKGEALVSGQVVDFAFTFPVTPNSVKGNSDVNTGFLVKLDARGEKMLVGIRGFGLGPVAYGPNDEIYVAGAMYGTAGISPTAGAFQSTHDLRGCGGTAFVGIACSYQYAAKISADGTRLIYSTFITGAFGARPAGLIIDSDENALIAGSTNSRDYPVTAGAYQSDYRVTNAPPPAPPTPHPPAYAPPSSGYLTKLNAGGMGLLWSTFFSGTGSETISSFALDAQGRILIAGLSGSKDLPGAQSVPKGCAARFAREAPYLAEFSADASTLIASRYVYGLDSGSPRIALSADGTPVIGGGEALKPIDLSAPTPLACTTDPADNATIANVAPGQLITLFGEDFGGEGVAVAIDGILAPLLYASPGQINAQIPLELKGRDVVTLTVQTAGGPTLSRPLRIVPRAPSAFLANGDFNPLNPVLSCKGFTFGIAYAPVARNEDGSFNTCDSPAEPGSVITFYLNGLGATTPAVTLAYPSSGVIQNVEQDPGSPPGVWRLRVQLPGGGMAGAIEPVIDGMELREPVLAVWIRH